MARESARDLNGPGRKTLCRAGRPPADLTPRVQGTTARHYVEEQRSSGGAQGRRPGFQVPVCSPSLTSHSGSLSFSLLICKSEVSTPCLAEQLLRAGDESEPSVTQSLRGAYSFLHTHLLQGEGSSLAPAYLLDRHALAMDR